LQNLDDLPSLIFSDKPVILFPTDPHDWSKPDAEAWMRWAMELYNVVSDRPLQDWVTEGLSLLQLTEEKFKEKICCVSEKCLFVYM